MSLPKIVADMRVPPGEAWFTEPARFELTIIGARVVLTRIDRVLGKIVGLSAGGGTEPE